ncbi:MAG: putative selenium-dependent hydroxylase accessory protein YqeC [Acidobacteria bacterium]|nr:putative selenium-dependent hydroxylase accessory protein YqeC [Acidobacteriota bacterium]
MDLTSALKLQHQDVVSFVGGGGKTTSVFRLGREFAQAGKWAIITTTTRMGPWQTNDPELLVIGSSTPRSSPAVLGQIEALLARDSVIMVVGEARTGKLIGVHPDVVSDLLPLADAVLVEADGARSRSLKAPAPYEPVWPSVTTMAVAVIGIDAVGVRLDPASIHRPERVAAITGLALGESITAQAVNACVLHPEGLFARVPVQARRVVLINKVKTDRQLAAAKEIAGLLTSHNSSLHVIIADVQVQAVKIWS